jgi:hypothetical protein
MTIHKCNKCGYKTKYSTCLKNHLNRKKPCTTAPNIAPTAPNIAPTAPNIAPTAPNSAPTAQISNTVKISNNPKQCKYCFKVFSRPSVMKKHLSLNRCKLNKTILKNRDEDFEYIIEEESDNSNAEIQKKLEKVLEEHENFKEKISILEKKENNTNVINIYSTVSNNNNEAVIDIETQESSEAIETSESEYVLKPLEVCDGYIIENREEDNYINVTNLCKAGKKQFKHWKELERTKAFLQVLSSSVVIPTVELIKYNIGGNGERHTWVHPQVAINIAQWISPHFDVKVSSWVYEVMMTGKVDISNTKSYKQLQAENKDKQLKINMLTKKYVKKVPRIQYTESNVIYILTTERLKKDHVYILGKATNLTSRLSTYNKTDEHEVIYHQQCPDEEKMAVVENMVFTKLDRYRESANRERFILPDDEKIDIFIDIIKECITFLC